jgi:hypothetical protein
MGVGNVIELLGLMAFVIASLVIGGRIFLLTTRTRQLPEMAVSMSLLLSGGIGTGLVVLPVLVPDLSAEAMYYSFQAGSASNHVGDIASSFCLFGACSDRERAGLPVSLRCRRPFSGRVESGRAQGSGS